MQSFTQADDDADPRLESVAHSAALSTDSRLEPTTVLQLRERFRGQHPVGRTWEMSETRAQKRRRLFAEHLEKTFGPNPDTKQLLAQNRRIERRKRAQYRGGR